MHFPFSARKWVGEWCGKSLNLSIEMDKNGYSQLTGYLKACAFLYSRKSFLSTQFSPNLINSILRGIELELCLKEVTSQEGISKSSVTVFTRSNWQGNIALHGIWSCWKPWYMARKSDLALWRSHFQINQIKPSREEQW